MEQLLVSRARANSTPLRTSQVTTRLRSTSSVSGRGWCERRLNVGVSGGRSLSGALQRLQVDLGCVGKRRTRERERSVSAVASGPEHQGSGRDRGLVSRASEALGEPRQCSFDRLKNGLVEEEPPFTPRVDETRRVEDLRVVGDRRLREGEPLVEL